MATQNGLFVCVCVSDSQPPVVPPAKVSWALGQFAPKAKAKLVVLVGIKKEQLLVVMIGGGGWRKFVVCVKSEIVESIMQNEKKMNNKKKKRILAVDEAYGGKGKRLI